MAKILAKKWKDCKAKKPTSLLSVDDRKRQRAERKARASECRRKSEEIREKKREYFQMLKQKREDRKARRA